MSKKKKHKSPIKLINAITKLLLALAAVITSIAALIQALK